MVAHMRASLRSLGEIYRESERGMDPGAWSYLAAGAGTEVSVALNRSAFDRWHLLPDPLRGLRQVDTSTTLMGVALSSPIVTGPVGTYTAFHPDGDLAVARAAARFGTASIVPVLSSYTLEETAETAPASAKLFQALASGPPETFLVLAARANAAGYEAICLTIDAYPRGVRDRVMESHFDLPAEAFAANYETDAETEMELHIELGATAWSWATVRDLIAQVDLPVMVKGVLTARTALASIDAGAAAIMVSNVGGRQLDGAPAALEQLPGIVEAVAGRVEIAFDSGIRRGTDVLKAVALGARAVSIGRASAMGLAVGGEEGVAAVLQLLHDELATSMALCGAGSISAVGPDLLQRAEGVL
jgi:isopentenyl diphosphate isomerase/L-lactate dehydrogenase-like FMN-dependent dehydrogenase